MGWIEALVSTAIEDPAETVVNIIDPKDHSKDSTIRELVEKVEKLEKNQ